MHSIEKYSIIRLSIGFKSAANHMVIMNFHDFLNDWFWFVCQLVWCLFLILYFKILIYIRFPPKKVPNPYPEDYPPKEKMLGIVIWQLFWEI